MKFFVRVILLLLLALFLAFLYLPSPGLRSASPRTSAKNDIVQIVNAIRNYYVDYGRYPKVTDTGLCETPESNARLIRILIGEEQGENPRRIRYLEVPKGREKNGIFRSGIHPQTGAWVDPWGNFYRIGMATDWDRVENPYSDDGAKFLDAAVIAWSIGKDGVQGSLANPKRKKGADDTVSWE